MKGVFLVGAGPGDRDLITVRGKQLIESADAIVYDNLANPDLLLYKKEACKCIYVGKKSSDHTMTQEEINALLIRLGQENRCVVRLKGGDPYVFGRGREEGEALKSADIDFEVVPGITSAIGGLAYAGIPITSRQLATSFHVITGHLSDKSQPVDFKALASMKGTLVFLMGVKNLPRIIEQLLKHGKDEKTPVAIIYKASTPNQKVYTGTLVDIVETARRENVKPPSLIVIGEVVNHRDTLKFFEERPLFGKHILVTRSRQNHSKMTDMLLRKGAKVTLMPGIQMVQKNKSLLKEKIQSLSSYTGIVFTSGVAVKIFFETFEVENKDLRSLHHLKFVVVGNETKKVLRKYGLIADYVPDSFCNDGIQSLIQKHFNSQDHLFLPRSAKGDANLVSAISMICDVEELHIYDTELVKEVTPCEEAVDYVTFTSSSTVQGFMHQLTLNKALKNKLSKAKYVSIGPVTDKTLEEYGYTSDLIPDTYTIQDMVRVIEEDIRKDNE